MSATETETIPVEGTAIQLVIPEEVTEIQTRDSLKESFVGYFEQADKWRLTALTINITDPSQKQAMKLARDTRLALKDIRVNADKTRKMLKEDSLRKGRAIDGIYNMLLYAIEPLEQHLLEQEKYVERMEAERKEQLKAQREQELLPLGVDCSLYQLGEISEASYQSLLDTNRLAHIARLEHARKAEAERIAREKAEAEERERVRIENERLKAEAAAQAEIIRKEREATAKKQREAEAKARKEREAIEAKARAEREASEAKIRAEREAREKAQAELRAKQEAEKAALAAQAKAAAKAARAPDKNKVLAFAAMVRCLPEIEAKTDDGKAVAHEVHAKVESFAAWIETQAETL